MEKNKRIQANVNKNIAMQAELIINELGLTPTVVINALYKKIAATGEIPFSFKLTSEQLADLELRELVKKIPQEKVRSRQELEYFFNED